MGGPMSAQKEAQNQKAMPGRKDERPKSVMHVLFCNIRYATIFQAVWLVAFLF